MDKTNVSTGNVATSVRRNLQLRGWKLDWHGEDAKRTTNLYLVDGTWQPLGCREQGCEFVLPGGFSACLTDLGAKTLRDYFGREARLTSQLICGEPTPVVIDHDGNRYELVAA